MPGEIIEAEDMDEVRSLAVRADAAPAQWTPSFAIAIDEAVSRVEQKHDFFKRVMREGDHYGVIPGTGTKPTLLKPGAELLLANMGLNAEFSDAEPPTIDILGTDHNGEPFIRYRRVCRIYRQLGPTEDERMLVGKAEGACSSWETKYRYRNDRLKCPECGKPTIIKAKDFSGAGRDLGWVCWQKAGKSDGCGAQYPAGDTRIAGQVVGKIPNPDVADSENTILKMADKRALVAATLIATGCSDIFTQDLEPSDGDDTAPASSPAARTASASPEPTKPQPASSTTPKNEPPADAGSLFESAAEEPQRVKDSRAAMTHFNTMTAELAELLEKHPADVIRDVVSPIARAVQRQHGSRESGVVGDLLKGDEANETGTQIRAKIDDLKAAKLA